MTERQSICRAIQSDPLNLRSWTELQQAYLDTGDALSAKSIATIVQGIAELNEMLQREDRSLTNMQRHAFSRLAMAHNNSGLLKEIGIFYLHEFRLPSVAIQHFEMAKRFRTSDGDLDALLANAKSAQVRATIKQDGGESGVVTAKHTRPPVKEMLQHTGKLSFHKKTEGMPAIPRELLNRGKAKAGSLPAKPPVHDPGGSHAPDPDQPDLPPVPRTQEEPGNLEHDLRLEHEGEYFSLQQATDRLVQLAEKSRFDSALTLLETIIATSPALDLSWSAATQLGQTCFRLQRYEWAGAAFQHAANLLPDEMVSWFNLGLALQNLGQLNDAMEVYERADRLEPGHSKVWCNMSALYFQSDRLDQAEDAARKSLEADPEYARAWDNLASALGAQGQIEEAEQAARRAIALKPDFAEPWLKLGMICFQQDRLEESEEAFLRAKGLTEISAYALCYLAIIRTRNRHLEEAALMVRQATQVDPTCEMLWMSWNEIGMAQLKLGHYGDAAETFGLAIECQPENFQIWFNRALAFQRSDQLQEAERCYREALNRDNASSTAWRSLGQVARDLEHEMEAIDAFARLVELEPDNPAAWSDYASALDAAGKTAEARNARAKARDITNRRHAEANKLGQAFSYLRTRT